MDGNYDILFIGPFVHSTKTNNFELIENGIIGIQGSKITFVDKDHNRIDELTSQEKCGSVVKLKDGYGKNFVLEKNYRHC